MNIVILGPQGSGKGTQAELVAEKYNLVHVETGKILREIASSDHPLSAEVRRTMNEGKLVSDRILENVLEGVLTSTSKSGFVFDGTPRDIDQFNLIDKILGRVGQKIDMVILINISENETIKRLSSRRTCEKCGKVYNLLTNPSPGGQKCECGGALIQREDDFPDLIKKRLQTYHKETSAVLSKAKSKGILKEINGERPIEEIFDDIVQTISTNFSDYKVN
jgi:adenylate kinase